MAAARAEARRKAILSRGTDRLAKLTTSARGEDAPAYVHDDPPLPSMHAASSFLGDNSADMPSRVSLSPSPSPQPPSRGTPGPQGRPANIFEAMAAGGGAGDNTAWGGDQQQQFMQALMNASGGGGQMPQLNGESTPPVDNPFAALMAASAAGLGGPGGAGGAGPGMFGPFGPPGMAGGGFPGAMEVQKPKSRLQKVLPLLHLVAMWCLLGYFVFWAEPTVHRELVGHDAGLDALSLWRRWANLGHSSSFLSDSVERFKVHIVPFFWAFTTLQIALHSLRIVSGFDSVQPPMLLALALPHLPPPLPSVITNGLKYMQMGSLFLDDLAGLIVGLGFIVYFSGWFSKAT